MSTHVSTTMQVLATVRLMRDYRAAIPASQSLALVPTMGALHEGHLALIRRGRELADHVVVSVFVNPAQFAPNEDFQRYPRPVERDLEYCRQQGVDAVFHPSVDEMYPPGQSPVAVDVPELSQMLEGESRPHFFPGVCRVVAKLFNIIQPRYAVFGRKDYQQLLVVTAMARGLSMPVEIIPMDTVREPDGLAMSSRNVYLEPDARAHALSLIKALREAEQLIRDGVMDPAAVEHAMRQALAAHQAQVDYAVVRDARTLRPLDIVNVQRSPVVCLVAARIGGVRLIDNVVLEK